MASKNFFFCIQKFCVQQKFIRHSKKFRHDVQNASKIIEMASKNFSFASKNFVSNKKFYKALNKI